MALLGLMSLIPLGVILNHADTFHHFRDILALLDPADFELVIAGDREALERIARDQEYASVWYQDIYLQGPRYEFTLSNYYIYYYDVRSEQGQFKGRLYLPQMIGKQAIRLMYTLGVDYWSYGNWNTIFQHQFCYGPWQAERLQAFGGKTHQIGYPRYDRFFNQTRNADQNRAFVSQLGGDPDKASIVCLPTRYQHTLRLFAETLAALNSEYNVFVKPHPLTWQEEPGLIRWLQTLPFTALIEGADSLQLLSIADFVVCDYGGSAFGALYTDRNLLLFNHYPDTLFDPVKLHIELPSARPMTVHKLNPTEVYLRQSIANLDPGQQTQLPALLKDFDFWKAQKQMRANLRQEFFAPYYGNSAQQAAEILKTLMA